MRSPDQKNSQIANGNNRKELRIDIINIRFMDLFSIDEVMKSGGVGQRRGEEEAYWQNDETRKERKKSANWGPRRTALRATENREM